MCHITQYTAGYPIDVCRYSPAQNEKPALLSIWQGSGSRSLSIFSSSFHEHRMTTLHSAAEQ